MSFRKYGGLSYAAKNNIVSNNYNSINNLQVTENVGQPNSYINFESDISGNNLFLSGNIDCCGNMILSGNLYVGEDIDCSGNTNIQDNLYVGGNIDCIGSTTIDENLNVGGDINCNGDVSIEHNLYVGGDINFNSSNLVSNLFASKDIATENIGVSNICSVGLLDCLTSINCDNITANNNIQYNFKVVAYLINAGSYPFIPLCKTILNPTTYCSDGINNGIDLTQLFENNEINLFLFPTYKIIMYNSYGYIIWSYDNTYGNNIIFTTIPTITNLNKIIIYNNNIPIL
jgi:predicted acyltransferase (DUF342 family)